MLLETAAILYGISNIMKADKNNEEAARITMRAFKKMEESNTKLIQANEELNESITKLANRKMGVLKTSMTKFLNLYETIMKIDFQESEGLLELKNKSFGHEEQKHLNEMITTSTNGITGKQELVAFCFGGIPGIFKRESEENVNAAKVWSKQVRLINSQKETICVELEAIQQRVEKTASILAKMNLLFTKVLKETESIISKNGSNRQNYSTQEKDFLMVCINFAVAIKNILDVKILDSSGDITDASRQVIEAGENYIQKVNEYLIGGN